MRAAVIPPSPNDFAGNATLPAWLPSALQTSLNCENRFLMTHALPPFATSMTKLSERRRRRARRAGRPASGPVGHRRHTERRSAQQAHRSASATAAPCTARPVGQPEKFGRAQVGERAEQGRSDRASTSSDDAEERRREVTFLVGKPKPRRNKQDEWETTVVAETARDFWALDVRAGVEGWGDCCGVMRRVQSYTTCEFLPSSSVSTRGTTVVTPAKIDADAIPDRSRERAAAPPLRWAGRLPALAKAKLVASFFHDVSFA